MRMAPSVLCAVWLAALWAAVPGEADSFLAAPVASSAITIEHAGVTCLVAGQFPRFEARLSPAESVGHARLHFRPDATEKWYAVVMKPEGLVFSAVIPKPKKRLKKLNYYIDATNAALVPTRTEEFAPSVDSGPLACKDKVMAGTVPSATVALEVPAGAPTVPPGFDAEGVTALATTAPAAAAVAGTAVAAGASGGLSTGAIVGIGAGVVAVGAAAVVLSSSKSATPAPTPTPIPTVTGTWTGTGIWASSSCPPNTGGETDTLTFAFSEATSGALSGTLHLVVATVCGSPVNSPQSNTTVPVTGSVSYPSLTFTAPVFSETISYTGTVAGTSMNGTFQTNDGSSGTWNAVFSHP